MSMPNIPNMNAEITVTRDDAVNIILTSIGMEELSLAHILNAEAEKIQFALGTLETATEAASLDDILMVNNSAKRMLRDAIKNQMLIGMKMEDTLELAQSMTPTTEQAEEKAPAEEPVAEEEPAPEAEPVEEEAVVEEA